MDTSKALRNILELKNKFQKYDKIINNKDLFSLNKTIEDFGNKIDLIQDENRTFKLGIVGQVKAGKSSFLNALLFEGKDYLPKAATPMTAALTRIRYSEKNSAQVEFFSREDWKIIEEKKMEYDRIIDTEFRREQEKFKANSSKRKEPTRELIESMCKDKIAEELKAAKELVDMYNNQNLYNEDLFGKTDYIDLDNEFEFSTKLKNYVGASGKYTPLVKNTTLNMNVVSLKGIEIVDTPGTNDPILSRGLKTKEFLSQCDFIIMMSYSGQFLDSSDVNYIIEKLPAEGIRNVLLVGSKFDTVLLQQNTHYDGDIKKAYINEKRKLETQAKRVLDPLLNDNPNNEKLQTIKNAMPPLFVSSMAYQIYKNYDNLNSEQEHIFESLKKDYYKSNLDKDILLGISFINNIKINKFNEIKEKKEQYMETKLVDLVSGQKDLLRKIINTIKSDLDSTLENLLYNSEEDVEKKYNNIISKIDSSEERIKIIFSASKLKMKKDFENAKFELKSSTNFYTQLTTHRETKVEDRVIEKDWGFRWKFWPHEEIVQERVSYSYANVYEAIEKVQKFTIEIEKTIFNVIGKIFDKKQMSIELKKAVLECFDLADSKFDENTIVIPVQRALDEISVPTISFDGSKYTERILKSFNKSTVYQEEVEQLIHLQYKTINEILSELQKEFGDHGDIIIEILNKTENDFTCSIKKNFTNQLDNLKKIMKEKDKNVDLINEALFLIENTSI